MLSKLVGKEYNLFTDGTTVTRFRVNNSQVQISLTCLQADYNYGSEMLLKFALNGNQFWLPFGAY